MMGANAPGIPPVLRVMNDRATLELLLEHGPMTRRRIGRLTGLSLPTTSQQMARLQAEGLVLSTGSTQTGSGQSAARYSLNPRVAFVAAADVTPHGVHAAVSDITGVIVGEHVAGPPGRGEREVVRHLGQVVEEAVKAAGISFEQVQRLVVGTPGAFDPATGRLRYASHLPGWHSPTLLERVAAIMPLPVEYENDVNLVALAEHRLGAAKECDNFVLLWNEEGLGGALILNGTLHRGHTGGAGEVGFMPVPGAQLVRGVARANSGGFERLVGSEALPAIAQTLGISCSKPASNRDRAVALMARAADAVSGPYRELLHRYAAGLAVGLASVASFLDPELIVLSGALNTAGGERLRARVQVELGSLAASRPRLVLGSVRHAPVLRGALENALLSTREHVFDTSR